MSLAFSRRSFLKYSAVAAVAVAGASLFSGCDQTDTKNLYCEGAGSITVLQVKAVMGTNDENSNKYVAPELSVGDTSIELPFAITVGRTNNLPINVNNFMITVTDKDGKNAKTYNVTLDGLFRTNLKNNDTATGKVKATVDALKAGDKVILTYCPDLQYAEYSMNWSLAVPAEETNAKSPATTKSPQRTSQAVRESRAAFLRRRIGKVSQFFFKF